ncbi:MAG: fasciclin domain-containing protein [Mucilaginibacter sp.]
MNKLITILLFFNVSVVFAQKADSVSAKTGKVKNVDRTLMSSSKDLIDNLSASPQFTTLVKAINAAGLAENLKTGTITFFAPANQAFEKLPPGLLDTLLLPAHKAALINLVNYHTVQGKVTSKDIEKQIRAGNGQATFSTLTGGTFTARINENRNIVLTDENGGQSIVTRLDIEQSNGILFVVIAVLQPKAKE